MEQEKSQEQEQTWADRVKVVHGVKPLEPEQQQQGLRVLQSILQNKNNPSKAKKIFGNAKESAEGDSENSRLAADVDLVAFGVRKDVSEQMMKDWLNSKNIDAEVRIMTRPEVLSEVRTISMKVTVKASQHEEAMKPEVWPYRVGVRLWDNRTVRRERQERQELGRDLGQGSGGGEGEGAEAVVGGAGAGRMRQQQQWQLPRRRGNYGGGGGQFTNQNIFELLKLVTNSN